MRDAWALDPAITFLNHGSFGACPREVLAHQALLRAQLEAEPVRFMVRELEPLLDEARRRLAAFVGAQPADLAFVPNATTAVNTVLHSLDLAPGDELLTLSHAYNACLNALRAVAHRAQATVVVAPLPLPVPGPEAVLEAVRRAVTPRTRLVLLDHVTSPTALVLPVEPLVRELEARGIAVLVDGAHAPGLLPLALDALGASYATGNLHKWVCAPKGAAFLHVRRDRQKAVRPLVVSHGANSPRTDRSRFHLEFDWVGTVDPTAYLCVPKALDVLAAMDPDGWPGLMRRNRDDALAARRLLLETLGSEALAPESMLGAMAAVEVPHPPGDLQELLFHQHRVEVPVIAFEGRTLVRTSAQRHVRKGDVEVLARALAPYARR
jgi:isopenicillin-N epimerase